MASYLEKYLKIRVISNRALHEGICKAHDSKTNYIILSEQAKKNAGCRECRYNLADISVISVSDCK